MVDGTLIREVALGYYRQSGHGVEEIDGLYRITSPPETEQRLLGGPEPGGEVWLTFQAGETKNGIRTSGSTTPPPEILAPGSYRLAEIMEGIREEGHFFRGRLEPFWPDPVSSFALHLSRGQGLEPDASLSLVKTGEEDEPWLMICFAASRRGSTLADKLVSPAVNLRTGGVVSTLKPLMDRGPATVAESLRIKKKMSIRLAYRLLVQKAALMMTEKGLDWIQQAQDAQRQEEEHLNTFYQAALGEEKDPVARQELSQAWTLRLEEAARSYTPRLLLRPCAAALFHIPVLKGRFILAGARGTRRLTSAYDGVTETWRSVQE